MKSIPRHDQSESELSSRSDIYTPVPPKSPLQDTAKEDVFNQKKLKLQEHAEYKAEKKSRTNASRKTQILQSFVLPSSLPYRNPPYSKNVGRRYSPPGGLQ